MSKDVHRLPNTPYEGSYLSRTAFPLGGIGSGMLCVEGCGAFSHLSVRNVPDIPNEPMMFAALKVRGHNQTARLLQGPVPKWKIFGPLRSGLGARGRIYGFPRFNTSCLEARFPFAEIEFGHPAVPLRCRLTAWSPFIPNHADDSGLPMAVLEYTFRNPTPEPLDSVFSFHSANFMANGYIR